MKHNEFSSTHPGPLDDAYHFRSSLDVRPVDSRRMVTFLNQRGVALPTFKTVHPVLPVRDVKKAVAYYQDRLGFTLKFQDDPNDPKYAGVERGSVELHLQWHDEMDFNKVERLALRFVIDDVDSLFEEYKDKDVFHSRTKLQNTSWGTREFAFFDLDGNGLFFYRDLD